MRQGDERNPPADTGASGWAAVPFFNYLLTKPGFALNRRINSTAGTLPAPSVIPGSLNAARHMPYSKAF